MASIIDVTTRDGSTVPAIVLPDGTTRRLDLIRPARPNMLALPSVASQVEIIPRQEWPSLITQTMAVRSVKLRNKNQLAHGSCTGHGTVSLLEFLRRLAGMADAELSPTYPYAHCNGDRDAGAVGSEVMKFVADRGTCTLDLCGEDTIFAGRIPPAADVVAPRYRFGEILSISTFDEMATICLTRGGFCYGIEVGNRFNDLTAEGVARCARGMGNHWVMGLHLARLKDGQFGIYSQNSWGTDWGDDGRMTILEQDIMNYGDWPDATAALSVLPDPQSPADIPPLVAA